MESTIRIIGVILKVVSKVVSKICKASICAVFRVQDNVSDSRYQLAYKKPCNYVK